MFVINASGEMAPPVNLFLSSASLQVPLAGGRLSYRVPFKTWRMTPLIACRRNQRGGLQTLHGVYELFASFRLMGILLRERYRQDPVWYLVPVLVT